MRLRDYQASAVERIISHLREKPSTLAVLPTGTGKTVVIAELCRLASRKVLILAHRSELVEQAAATVQRFSGKPCGIEMADRGAGDEPVVVASVQSLSRRLDKLDPSEFELIVTDESHHASASTYRRIANRIFAANPYVGHLGVTATPDRADGVSLGEVFDSVAFQYSMFDAISDGWLVPVDQIRVTTDAMDVSELRASKGDFRDRDIEKLTRADEVQQVIVQAVRDHAVGQTVIFTAGVATAHGIAQKLGSRAVAIDGKTSADERASILKRFAAGEIQYVANCQILTEGFDSPAIQTVFMARPTKSRALFAQCVGRGTRSLPGIVDGLQTADARRAAIAASDKPSCLVVDMACNVGRHRLVSTVDLLAANVSDELREAADQILRKSSGTVPSEALLKEASKRAKQLRAEFLIERFDPFGDLLEVRFTGSIGGDAATPQQLSVLNGWGVAKAKLAGLSRIEADQLLTAIRKRRDAGLCSLKQAKILRQHGYPTDMDKEAASDIITMIAASGWVPAPLYSDVPGEVLR